MKTFYANPEREERIKLEQQYKKINSISYLKEMINALPNVITILNDKRQVIFSNDMLLKQLNITDLGSFLGKRPGDILNCVNSDCESGCGTSEKCRVCGAVNSVLLSLMENRKVIDECRINAKVNGHTEALDFEVTAAPFNYQNEKFIIFSVKDISDEKRRKMLERIFFHDILNTAGNVRGLTELVQSLEDQEEKEKLLTLMSKVSNELVEEIEAQRQLVAAEDGELIVRKEKVDAMEILQQVASQFTNGSNPGLEITIDKLREPIELFTDKSLLSRIIRNMLKNALEATPRGEAVKAGVQKQNASFRFYVRNAAFIPVDVQLQIFNRSFSTKGLDRGLGTYSMKLLGERYLKGKVYFESSKEKGTIFYFEV